MAVSDTTQLILARPVNEIMSVGSSFPLDLAVLALGYASLAYAVLWLAFAALLIGAATGGSNSRGWQVLRAMLLLVRDQAREGGRQLWQKLQLLAMMTLQSLVFPCYVGHLVVCLLCEPVLHLSQHARASATTANPLVTFVMQVFIGYVHLWGIAFIEGCLSDVFVPAVVQRASSNFFIGAISSHRRFFGTVGEEPGPGDSPPMPAHWATLKLALVQVAVHTPLAFLLWYLPAVMLDRFLGDSLFPMHLVDRSGGQLVAAPAIRTNGGSTAGNAGGSSTDGPLFVLELMQLYILVLQCIRILEASPALAKLTVGLLRCTMQRLGLSQILAPAGNASAAASPAAPSQSPAEEASQLAVRPQQEQVLAGKESSQIEASSQQEQGAAEKSAESSAQQGVRDASPRPASELLLALCATVWRFLVVSGLIIILCWVVMALVLALPLSLGRLIVRCVLSTQAKRISDFLPLSMGVVVASASILITVKVCEALPAILDRAATLGSRRRLLHCVLCTSSALAMSGAVLVLLPLGLGTLLLRVVLPLKVRSVYQAPIIFLITDCWSLGLVLTKVIWRLVQTDMIMHTLHREIMAAWATAQGSLTNMFFDLQAHGRIWRCLVLPLLEVVLLHLIFPYTAAYTFLLCMAGSSSNEYLRAALLMYCYHIVLVIRLWFILLPRIRLWLTEVRQSIFDSKYLVSTELQNYHTVESHGEPSDTESSSAVHSPFVAS